MLTKKETTMKLSYRAHAGITVAGPNRPNLVFFLVGHGSLANANFQLSSRRHVPPETTSEPFPTLYRATIRALTFHSRREQPSP
jgi:hypothetical protein